MEITVKKGLFSESVSIELSSGGVLSLFEGVTSAHEGSRAGDFVCLWLCQNTNPIGMLTVSNDRAETLVTDLRQHGVYSDENPFELSAAS